MDRARGKGKQGRSGGAAAPGSHGAGRYLELHGIDLDPRRWAADMPLGNFPRRHWPESWKPRVHIGCATPVPGTRLRAEPTCCPCSTTFSTLADCRGFGRQRPHLSH